MKYPYNLIKNIYFPANAPKHVKSQFPFPFPHHDKKRKRKKILTMKISIAKTFLPLFLVFHMYLQPKNRVFLLTYCFYFQFYFPFLQFVFSNKNYKMCSFIECITRNFFIDKKYIKIITIFHKKLELYFIIIFLIFYILDNLIVKYQLYLFKLTFL